MSYRHGYKLGGNANESPVARGKGFSGPPDMPAHVREIFVRTVEEIVKGPRVVEQLAKRFDAVPAFLGPKAFERSVREEANVVERLQKLLQSNRGSAASGQ